MKKIISILACVCLLLSAIVIPASAADSASYVVADTVSTGTAYKFGMIQEKVSTTDVYYINGTMANTYYLGTTTDASAALDVYLEEAAGGYYLSTTIDGAKKYINMVTSGTHVNGKYEDSASTIYTFNAEKKALISIVNGEEYWIGTRNDKTFTTVGPVKVSYNGFYCQLYVESTNSGGDVTPPTDGDDSTDTPDAPTANSATYVFADYVVSGELGGANVVRELDSNVTFEISSGWISSDTARIYKNSNAVISSKVDIASIVVNAGNKDSTFVVYTSADGETWDKYIDAVPFTTAYSDITIEFDPAVKYIKIDAPNAQVRMKTLTVNFVASEGGDDEGGEVTPPAGDDEGGEDTPPAGDDEGGEVTPPAGDDEENKPSTDDSAYGVIENPVAGTAYKFGMVQGNLGKTLYLTGEMDGFYMATTEDVAAAADVYLEETTGGYYIYAMVNGAKKYLGITEAEGTDGKLHINAVFNDTPVSVFTYNDTIGSFATKVGEKEYGFGTRNDKNYTTISPSSTEYPNNFICKFYGEGGKVEDIPSTDNKEDDKTEDDKTETPTANAVETPVAGTAYKYALIQENLGKVLYITGEMDAEKTYYMGTTENVDEAADVYLEETTGGYYIYALVGGVKKYMNIVESEGNDGKMHINAVYGDTGVSVFTQNTEKNVFVTKLGEDEYAFGTYNTFNTVSPSNFNKYPDNFWCKFYAGKVETNNSPSTEDKKDDTTTTDGENKEEQKLTFGVVEQPVAGTAYKFGMYQANLKKTLYITGEMDGFYMATTDDVSKAADVYLEETTGGYYIYALVNGAKKYLGITEAEGTDGKSHINAVFTDKPVSVFTYNATLKTYVTKVGDREFAFGTRNDKNYDTVSPSETKYTENFVCQFYGMTKGGTSPSTGDAVGSVIAMTMAIAAVMVYTSKKR